AAEDPIVFGDQHLGGIADLPEPGTLHLIDAELGRGPKTVFQGTEDAVHIIAISFKLEDGVHHMFQDLGAGYAAFLGDMPDQNDGGIALFGKFDEFRTAFPDLGNAARSGLYMVGVQGLYGIDDQQMGPELHELSKNVLGIGLGQDVTVVALRMDALCPHPDLPLAFLPRDIEGFVWKFQGNLQQQGAFSDAGLPSQEDQGTWDQSSAQNPVELPVHAVQALFLPL